MNIFYLDRDIDYAVRYHCDSHAVKMSLETAQIRCTALHRIGEPAPYKSTHAKHPSVLWCGDGLAHYQWLIRFGRALCAEYTYRYGRHHASEAVIDTLPDTPPLPDTGWTDPPQAMPDEFKRPDPVDGYRAFYVGEKAHFAKWMERPVPFFMALQTLGVAE